jgi:tRNA nucleotidyltransferase (CCA-adding enzyme)
VFPENRRVDVATARREFYEYPVAQPRVSSDSLKHDLYRRDYAVNAMAVSINEDDWGTLLDYFEAEGICNARCCGYCTI